MSGIMQASIEQSLVDQIAAKVAEKLKGKL